ncbi:MAG: histone deacetylase family protein [Pseudomonadota bacterium]
MVSSALISHEDCLRHMMGEHHPERPSRLLAIREELQRLGLDKKIKTYDAPLVQRSLLEATHDPDYVQKLFATAVEDELVWLDPDTAMSRHTLAAAQRAAGAAVLGVDLVMSHQAKTVFCAVRPPGHHAEYGRAMGFCFFNNVAVAARQGLAAYDLERIAIVDFDVHHGNGTENIFAGDDRVLVCSSFQHPFYPHSGHDCEATNVINLPLSAGSDGGEFRQAVQDKWLPALAEFAPQLILISAGFDAHRADDIAQLAFDEDDYAWITSKLVAQAERSAQGRIVSMLEGGYELQSLARSVASHLQVLSARD